MTCPFFVPRNDTLTLKWICINFTFSCCVYFFSAYGGRRVKPAPKDLSDPHGNAETISRCVCGDDEDDSRLHTVHIWSSWVPYHGLLQHTAKQWTHLRDFVDVKVPENVKVVSCEINIELWSKSETKVQHWLWLFLLDRNVFFPPPVNLKRCAVVKMRVTIKERLGSAASRGVGGADKNRLHYAVHLVNKWNNGEACSGNAGRMAQNPIESFWPLAA